MAVAVQLKGKTAIWIATPNLAIDGSGSAGELALLGYSRNGVTVSYEQYYLDVPGDENGGDDGPPIDIQWLGSTARFRIEFTKFDRTILERVLAIIESGSGSMTAWGGDIGDLSNPVKYIGKLLFTTTNYFRVLLLSEVQVGRNFPQCIIRAPAEYNYSTKYSAPILEFEAHKGTTGTLHDTTGTS